MHIRFDKMNRFIKVYDGVRYLLIFDYWLHDEIYNWIRYLISEISGITNSVNHNFARIRTDSYNSLPIEKILAFYNVKILIKSFVNKNKYHYC